MSAIWKHVAVLCSIPETAATRGNIIGWSLNVYVINWFTDICALEWEYINRSLADAHMPALFPTCRRIVGESESTHDATNIEHNSANTAIWQGISAKTPEARQTDSIHQRGWNQTKGGPSLAVGLALIRPSVRSNITQHDAQFRPRLRM